MDIDARIAIRNIIVSLIGIGLVVLVIVLLIKGFTGGTAEPSNRVNVTKYVYDSSIATMLADGPTVIDQDHRQARISVSNSQIEIDVIQGYQGKVIDTKSYANNAAAYNAFLQTLQREGFSKGRTSKDDYRGFCPAGNRYVYSFSRNQDEMFKYWATSCGQGTFEGDSDAVRQLFRRQIPPKDLSKMLNGTGINL